MILLISLSKRPIVMLSFLNYRYPHLPCLQVGREKNMYLPMEICTIIPGLRKLLSEQQIENMIRSTARPAPELLRDIQYWVCVSLPSVLESTRVYWNWVCTIYGVLLMI